MEHQVLKLFPEINEIENADLRSKVIACWAEAMAYRDWSTKELHSIPLHFSSKMCRSALSNMCAPAHKWLCPSMRY